MCGVTTRTTWKTERGRAKNARVENRILKNIQLAQYSWENYLYKIPL